MKYFNINFSIAEISISGHDNNKNNDNNSN